MECETRSLSPHITKRALVSDIAKTYDILGWFSPAIIKVKILLIFMSSLPNVVVLSSESEGELLKKKRMRSTEKARYSTLHRVYVFYEL